MSIIIRTTGLKRLTVGLVVILAFQLPVLASTDVVECKTVALPGNHRDDGMWSALYAAEKGLVYIGAQAHGGYSNLYQYDPETDVIRHIANIMEKTGEYGKGVRGQAKIHTRFVEDKNGVIYFGTGNQGSGPWNIDPRSWDGGRWWAYDPATDVLEDLGRVDRGRSDLYGLAYDRVNHRLYGTAWNGHLYIYDIDARTTTDAGRVSNWDVCRTIVTDDQGNCYGTSDKHQMFKYDATKGRLLDIPIIIPHDPFQWPRFTEPLQLSRKNIWRVADWSDHEKVIYLMEGGADYLSRYDPQNGSHGSVEFLSEMAAPHLRGNPDIPPATLSMVIGEDYRIYYAPVASSFDYGDEEEGITTGRVSFLVTYDPDTDERRDYGIMVEEDTGRQIFGTQGAAAGPDGKVYFFGAVEEPDSEKAVGRMQDGTGFVLKLIIIDTDQLDS